MQIKLGYIRDFSFVTDKVSNWCSLTDSAARKMIKEERLIKHWFRYSRCGDELLPMSFLKYFNLPVVEYNKLLFIRWQNGKPIVLNTQNYTDIKNSDCLFGRKFTDLSFDLIDKLNQH